MPRLTDLDLDRLLNFIWWWATRNGEPAQVEKFKASLWVPPPKYDKPITQGPWSPEDEARGFASLKTALGQ